MQCDVCQKCKDEHLPYPGLLQPLPEPHHSWSHISIDFIERPPKSEGKDVILVIVDRFTKCMTHHKPKAQAKWIPLAEWWYSTTYHLAIKQIPFEALYGIPPPQLAMGPYQQTSVSMVEDILQKRYKMDQQLKENLAQARSRIKMYANKNRTERQFEEGDWVYLKLHLYQQWSMAKRINQKLSPRYYGPYQIEKIGNVAYKLVFPNQEKIHLIFHVSLLKQKRGSRAVVIEQLPFG
ncbi:uncharacterized protein LOC111365530 [Olea europaea var. sylvestris]|uniref:uncharacterized protein LOC111365530 n=1 Tax=Olea europaea var. sylvestris TaxID=158386 RepID=UPI000C1D3148|nr:uncharacterized protein LOC111365530 [Olea europaea var. sylvestris]